MIFDLLKHLRFVHLILVLACIVIFLLNRMYNPDLLFKAYDQIAFVREVTENWNPKIIQELSQKIVDEYLKKKNFYNDNIFQTKYFQTKIDNETISFNVKFQKKNWTLRERLEPFIFEYTFADFSAEDSIYYGDAKGFHDLEERFSDDEDFNQLKARYNKGGSSNGIEYDQPIFLKKPKTLNEFIEFWDEFSTPLFIFMPKSIGKYLRIDFFDYRKDKNILRIFVDELKDKFNDESKSIKTYYFRLVPKLKVGEKDYYNKIPIDVGEIDKINLPSDKWPSKNNKFFTHEFYSANIDIDFEDENPDKIFNSIFKINWKSVLRFRIPVFTVKTEFNLQRQLYKQYQYAVFLRTGKFFDKFKVSPSFNFVNIRQTQ